MTLWTSKSFLKDGECVVIKSKVYLILSFKCRRRRRKREEKEEARSGRKRKKGGRGGGGSTKGEHGP